MGYFIAVYGLWAEVSADSMMCHLISLVWPVPSTLLWLCRDSALRGGGLAAAQLVRLP